MATIGRGRAVADLKRLHLKGWPAWMAWMFCASNIDCWHAQPNSYAYQLDLGQLHLSGTSLRLLITPRDTAAPPVGRILSLRRHIYLCQSTIRSRFLDG